jgi:hypothetical protein
MFSAFGGILAIRVHARQNGFAVAVIPVVVVKLHFCVIYPNQQWTKWQLLWTK